MAGETATAADSTHPTGMRSCLHSNYPDWSPFIELCKLTMGVTYLCDFMLNKDDHFPEVGAPILQRGRQHTILPQNYMKLKEFGPLGSSLAPLY